MQSRPAEAGFALEIGISFWKSIMTIAPRYISKITDYLFVSDWPRSEYVDDLLAMNVHLVITVNWMRPPSVLKQVSSVKSLWLPALDNPLFPVPLFILEKGVRAALPVIENGASVLVHCKEGKHRSVALASCILIAQGSAADDAMQQIKEKRAIADPYASHIQQQIRRFEKRWSERTF